jgi:hypothetical protein
MPCSCVAVFTFHPAGLSGVEKDPTSRLSDSPNRPFSRGSTGRTSSSGALQTSGSILGASTSHTFGIGMVTPPSPVGGSLAAKATVQGKLVMGSGIMGGGGTTREVHQQQHSAVQLRKAYSLDTRVYRTFSNSLYGDTDDEAGAGYDGYTNGGYTNGSHTISVTHNADWAPASSLYAAALSLNTSMTRQAMAAAAYAPAPRPPAQSNGIRSHGASMGRPPPRRSTRSDSGAMLPPSTAGIGSNRGPTGLPRAAAVTGAEAGSFYKLSHVSEVREVLMLREGRGGRM